MPVHQVTDAKSKTKSIQVVVFQSLPDTSTNPPTPGKYALRSLELPARSATTSPSTSSPSESGMMGSEMGGMMGATMTGPVGGTRVGSAMGGRKK